VRAHAFPLLDEDRRDVPSLERLHLAIEILLERFRRRPSLLRV
jgi:hypothetical protein